MSVRGSKRGTGPRDWCPCGRRKRYSQCHGANGGTWEPEQPRVGLLRVGAIIMWGPRQYNEWRDRMASTGEPLTDADARTAVEMVLDTLIEVGNGTTDEDLHEACDWMFRLRDDWMFRGDGA